jgi:hypothetical protein
MIPFHFARSLKSVVHSVLSKSNCRRIRNNQLTAEPAVVEILEQRRVFSATPMVAAVAADPHHNAPVVSTSSPQQQQLTIIVHTQSNHLSNKSVNYTITADARPTDVNAGKLVFNLQPTIQQHSNVQVSEFTIKKATDSSSPDLLRHTNPLTVTLSSQTSHLSNKFNGTIIGEPRTSDISTGTLAFKAQSSTQNQTNIHPISPLRC